MVVPNVIALASDGERVTITGTLTRVVGSTTRQERQWASAVLECVDGSVRTEVWPLAYRDFGHLVVDGAEVTIGGMVDRRDGIALRADDIASTGRVQIDSDQLIGELCTARRRRGTSQAALADRIGVSQQVLSSWEARKVRPNRHNLARWARALDRQPPPFRPAKYPTCGKPSGRRAHKRRGEEACDPCLDAAAQYMTEYREAKRSGEAAA